MPGPCQRWSLAASLMLMLTACNSTPKCVGEDEYLQAVDRLKPLLAAPGFSVVSIQRDVPAGDRDALAGLTHVGDDLADFQDTAAAVALCDLVITVDTSVAHLAGAMGRPLPSTTSRRSWG